MMYQGDHALPNPSLLLGASGTSPAWNERHQRNQVRYRRARIDFKRATQESPADMVAGIEQSSISRRQHDDLGKKQ
jgi:hypothetical protein